MDRYIEGGYENGCGSVPGSRFLLAGNERKGNNDRMNKKKAVFAFLLILILCFSAHAESSLVSLIGAAERLAYETDNVSITGKADFSLNGKRFKTAEINYIQDGFNSIWQEKLLTPREGKADLESGFTVIQNETAIHAIEVLEPYYLNYISASEQNTLLRRTAHSDLLLSLAKAVSAQLESWVSSILKSTKNADGSEDHLFELRDGEAPALLHPLIHSCMNFAGKRLFGFDDDDWEAQALRNAELPTETRQILKETASLALSDTSVRWHMDAAGRLTEMQGYLSVKLTRYSGKQQTFGIEFQLKLSDYGSSSAKPFQDIILMTDEERKALENQIRREKENELRELILKTCQDAGYTPYENEIIEKDQDAADLWVETKEGRIYITVNENHQIDYFRLAHSSWFNTHEPVEGLDDAEKQKILAFLNQIHPENPVADLKGYCQFKHDDNWLVELIGVDQNGQESSDTFLTVRLQPNWRIEYYTCIGMANDL